MLAVKRLMRYAGSDGGSQATIDDILKRSQGSAGDVKLSKTDVNVILRRKPKKDRLMVDKVSKAEDDPEMTIEKIRELAKKENEVVKQQDAEKSLVEPEKSVVNDILAYSSKLEMYLRGIEPVPENVKYFKYDLPIPNIDPEFKGIQEISDIISPVANTPNENLWLQLKDIDGDSSYEDFERSMQTRFNFEVDMYGQSEDIIAHQNMMVGHRVNFRLKPLERS